MSRSPGGLWCRHRDASGQETGSELIKAGSGGGHAFTRGGTRSLFHTPGPCRPRLVLVDGPLQAIALAALKPHAVHTATFAAPGGSWSRAADRVLTALVADSPPIEVILAFALLPDGSCPSRERVQTLLCDALPAGSREPLVLQPPPGGWVGALHEARSPTHRAA
ncbi:hypothetical protein [Roseomonas indoligenes]|uniref:Toprim domain-containing protein n=1 Tax=Roseomonas indoligenes TaxID=2820811 RepID=A0A940MZH5_9PROT|nr:hypothetical protein [Pararoseomonas indoligenes]MBP0495036.1 hypothetical protein [Pararoseomonas indoligenes]